jgi:ribonuclease VapC
MIVVDSSAIVAILRKEPEAARFIEAIQMADRAIMSAVNAHEAGMVLRGKLGPGGIEDFYDLCEALDIEIVPFGPDDARAALDAFERYGKGLPSSAGDLNLCDCAAYALAESMRAPLLFTGNDFTETDIERCL